MSDAIQHLEDKLNERREAGNLRSLTSSPLPHDFVSNDYLGLARSTELTQRIQYRFDRLPNVNKNGGSGSRLLSGNTAFVEQLEHKLAGLFKSEAALIMNSGYSVNVALISSIATRQDTILYDQLAHVCLKEGAWLSRADARPFRHNDVRDLELKLKQSQGNIFVVIETVYSMDGDIAPVQEIYDVCRYYGAHLIVDEAHSTGVMGLNGNGYLNEIGLADRVFARVYTFGKAMGVHGAAVAGSKTLIDYLINFGRPFIYTTALPLHSYVSIEQAFDYLFDNPEVVDTLRQRIDYFKKTLKSLKFKPKDLSYPGSYTAVQPLIIPGNEKIKSVARALQSAGFDVRPILAPTVKQGTERLRISLHSFNSEEEISSLLKTLSESLSA